jgi:hypothetical protein
MGGDFSSFPTGDTLDLFLLVGQSNMKGRGAIDMKPVENRSILFFHPKKQQWYIARDPLHALGTPDMIDGSDNSGPGPGMSFARTLAPTRQQTEDRIDPGRGRRRSDQLLWKGPTALQTLA